MPASVDRKYSLEYPPGICQAWNRGFHPKNRRQEGVTLAEKGYGAHSPMLSSTSWRGACSEEREGSVVCPRDSKVREIFFLIEDKSYLTKDTL